MPGEDGRRRAFTVPPEDGGSRIDVFLARYGELSRAGWQRLIIENRVTVNGATARKNHRVSPGETVVCALPELVPSEALPEDIPLDIVYEDADLLVINKPRGLVAHPSPGHESGTLVNALLHHCSGGLSGIGGVLRPGIVHRLDKDTSGLMVCAKNDMAHASLSAGLKERRVSRVYECVARGCPREERFTVSAPLGRHPEDRKRQAVLPEGRHAVTHVTLLAKYGGWSHLRCELETGRTHQIRVHLAYIGHPVAGDAVYGGRDTLGLGGQCLHAKELRFTHPRTGEEMRFETDYPDYFKKVLRVLQK